MPEPILTQWRTAELWRRLVAKIVDCLTFAFLLPLMGFGIQMSFYWYNIGPFALGMLVIPAVDIVLTKVFLGTPGKRLMGLRVLRTDGKPPTWRDCVQRRILWLILLVSMALQIGPILPGMPSEFDQVALTKALHEMPSNWAMLTESVQGQFPQPDFAVGEEDPKGSLAGELECLRDPDFSPEPVVRPALSHAAHRCRHDGHLGVRPRRGTDPRALGDGDLCAQDLESRVVPLGPSPGLLQRQALRRRHRDKR